MGVDKTALLHSKITKHTRENNSHLHCSKYKEKLIFANWWQMGDTNMQELFYAEGDSNFLLTDYKGARKRTLLHDQK